MKKQNFLPILLGFILAIGLSSCEDKVIQEVTYEANVPVYMSYDELYGSIEYSKTSEILENPGKIYYYKNFLFIGERTKGVHIFDNANPRSPQKVGFLNIPGNNDIAIRGNHLYADCFTDLLVFSLGDLKNMEMVKRIEDVFEYKIDIKEDACTSIDSEALKYAILNAISYLRYSFQNHKLNVLVGDIESAAGGIQCIVSYKHQDTAEHTSTSSKKNCNLIALQNFQKINPCFEFVLNNDNSLKMFFMMNQVISSE